MAGSVEELVHSYNAEYSVLYAKKEQLSNQIEAIQEQINAMQEQRNSIDLPNWVDCIVKPLAEQLAEKVGGGLEVQVWGPYGLFHRVHIYLIEDPEYSLRYQFYLSLTVQPRFDEDNNIKLVYETGEINSTYDKDSLGEANGGNMVTALLPNTIDEIVPLLHSHVPISLTAEGGK